MDRPESAGVERKKLTEVGEADSVVQRKRYEGMENGRASISRWSDDGSPWSKTAKRSSITRKSRASRVVPWTVTKNCPDPSIFREVKKGTSPIAVSSSHQRRSSKDQQRPGTANDSLLARHPWPAKRVTADDRLSPGNSRF